MTADKSLVSEVLLKFADVIERVRASEPYETFTELVKELRTEAARTADTAEVKTGAHSIRCQMANQTGLPWECIGPPECQSEECNHVSGPPGADYCLLCNEPMPRRSPAAAAPKEEEHRTLKHFGRPEDCPICQKYLGPNPVPVTPAAVTEGLGEPKLEVDQTTDLRAIVREHFVPTPPLSSRTPPMEAVDKIGLACPHGREKRTCGECNARTPQDAGHIPPMRMLKDAEENFLHREPAAVESELKAAREMRNEPAAFSKSTQGGFQIDEANRAALAWLHEANIAPESDRGATAYDAFVDAWNTRPPAAAQGEERDWKAMYRDEFNIVARVWKALGITNFEGASGKTIDQIVTEQVAELARLRAGTGEGVVVPRDLFKRTTDLLGQALKHLGDSPQELPMSYEVLNELRALNSGRTGTGEAP